MLMYLIVRANKERRRSEVGDWEFPQWIEVKSSDLMEAMNLVKRQAMYSIRDELEQGGWILHIPGIGNHPSTYMVLPTRPAERARIEKDPREKEALKRLLIWSRYREILP